VAGKLFKVKDPVVSKDGQEGVIDTLGANHVKVKLKGDGMSASKMRAAACNNDIVAFTQGLPKKFRDAEGLMNAVRSGMGLKEEKSFRQDIKLKKASNIREKFVAGKLFNVKDSVVSKDGQEGVIDTLGANHVKVKLNGDGNFKNFWLSDIITT
jgi:uncharacterized protein YkvS